MLNTQQVGTQRQLIDSGIDVHFASDNIDLASRGGRLSADIQAVVAADYIRNLREKTRKGFYGRLKQGVYPLAAPIGYLDQGAGNPKAVNPAQEPLVRRLFELYATGDYGINALVTWAAENGLRNHGGGLVSRNGMVRLLRNPFYIGLMRLRTTGEVFQGKHEPLISTQCFERVQQILDGKAPKTAQVHDHVFRRLFRCARSGYALIGERQKGRVYYRCHTKGCPSSAREDRIDSVVREALKPLEFTEWEQQWLTKLLDEYEYNWTRERESLQNALELKLNAVRDRFNRLVDAQLDGTIDKDTFQQRKSASHMEQQDLEEQRAHTVQVAHSVTETLRDFLEYAGNAYSSYKSALNGDKRELLRTVTSNRSIDGENVMVELSEPFDKVAERPKCTRSGLYRYRPRTLRALFDTIASFCRRSWRSDKHTGV